MNYKPLPVHIQIINAIIWNDRVAIFAGMGTGKSASTLSAIQTLRLVESFKVLVVAPLRVAQSTWPDEVAKWDQTRDLRVSVIVGTPAQRLKALNADADIYTTNYESLPWLVETLGAKWPFEMVVCDESTKLKSFRTRQGSKRAKALGSVAHNLVKRMVLLTGTPSPNGLQDLWGQMWFIDRGERLGLSFQSFLNRWFFPVRVGADPNAIRWDPRPDAQHGIQSAIADVCLSINLADYVDLSTPIVRNVVVKLPPKAREIYRSLERDLFVELAGQEIEAANAAAKTVKCLQAASGALYLDDGTFHEIHDMKLQALESIVEESGGMPLLVAYHFKSDLERLKKRFAQAKEIGRDPQTIANWNAGTIPMLLVHPASAGHGLNLQYGSNQLVMFSHWWDLEQYQQVVERIGPARQKQAGFNRPTIIYNIVAEQTIDRLVIDRRASKAHVQDILLTALKEVAA